MARLCQRLRHRLGIKKFVLIIFIAVTGGFGIWQTAAGISAVTEASQSFGWPSTAGKILSSSVVVTKSTTRHGSSSSYRPDVSYSYAVNGTTITSAEITPGRTWGTDSSYAVVKTFPAGSSATIYYSPTDPNEGLLLPGLHAYNFGALGFGLIFLTGACLFCSFLLQQKSAWSTSPVKSALATPILIGFIVLLVLEIGGMVWLSTL